MELKGAAYLYSLAAMAITFAGFSALLVGIRQAAGGRSSLLDRFLAKTILVQLFALAAGALLPPLSALYDVPEVWLWRVAAVCFAIPMLALLLTYPQRRRKAVGEGPPPVVFAVFVVLGSATVAVMLICILIGFQYEAGAYATALTVIFFTDALGFIAALDVIMRLPVDSNEGLG